MTRGLGRPALPDAVAVIPARWGSSRLPGKPLLRCGGRTLIEHVWTRVISAPVFSRVLIATDDARIADAVAAFGGEARITSSHHATGSDRIGELLPQLPEEIVVNVQGDEPDVDPELLESLVTTLQESDADVATGASPFPDGADWHSPHAVKVVTDLQNRALYFSRAAIPGSKVSGGRGPFQPRLHVGVYAFRRSALARFLQWPPSPLETTESLEQLRMLENGLRIAVVPARVSAGGIDTPEDFAAFAKRFGGDGDTVAPTPSEGGTPSGEN